MQLELDQDGHLVDYTIWNPAVWTFTCNTSVDQISHENSKP